MSGSNQATNLTGMLNQIGTQLGKERDISGLTRNIQNMSRPSGMLGGPEPGTDEYDQQLMNWQTKMGRPQEAAVTQAAMKQRQANTLAAGEAAKTAGDNAFAQSMAIAGSNLATAANSGDPTAYAQAQAEYNKVAGTAATTGQFDMVKNYGPQVERFGATATGKANEKDLSAYSNVKDRAKQIQNIPPERRTEKQVAELGQLENRLAQIEAKNPAAVDQYFKNLNTRLDAEGKQKSAEIAAGEEEAVAKGLELMVAGKSGKEIQDELAEKYGSMATEAIAVITDALDAREKWALTEGEAAYVTKGVAALNIEVAKLRQAGDEASSNLADALAVSIDLADSQKDSLPKTAVANINNAQNMLTSHLSGLALSKTKAEYEAAAAEAGRANAARAQATPENLDQAFTFLNEVKGGFGTGYNPMMDATTMNVLASDYHLVGLGFGSETVFEWDGENPRIANGRLVTRAGKNVAEAAASARLATTQQKLDAVNPPQSQSATTRRSRQDSTEPKTTVIGNVTITEKPQ